MRNIGIRYDELSVNLLFLVYNLIMGILTLPLKDFSRENPKQHNKNNGNLWDRKPLQPTSSSRDSQGLALSRISFVTN